MRSHRPDLIPAQKAKNLRPLALGIADSDDARDAVIGSYMLGVYNSRR